MPVHLTRLAPYLFAVAVLGLGPADGRAEFLTNGSFNAGLTEWDFSPAGSVQVVGVGASAVLSEDTSENVTLAWTTAYTLGTDALTMRFRVVAFTNGPNTGNGPPDFFQVALLGSNGQAVTPTAFPDSTAYYTRQLVVGAEEESFAFDPLDPLGTSVVTRSDPFADGSYFVDLDLTRLAPAVRTSPVRLQFILGGGGDGVDASVTIDDITVIRDTGNTGGGVVAVPGPSGVVMCVSAAPLVLLMSRRFRRK